MTEKTKEDPNDHDLAAKNFQIYQNKDNYQDFFKEIFVMCPLCYWRA